MIAPAALSFATCVASFFGPVTFDDRRAGGGWRVDGLVIVLYENGNPVQAASAVPSARARRRAPAPGHGRCRSCAGWHSTRGLAGRRLQFGAHTNRPSPRTRGYRTRVALAVPRLRRPTGRHSRRRSKEPKQPTRFVALTRTPRISDATIPICLRELNLPMAFHAASIPHCSPTHAHSIPHIGLTARDAGALLHRSLPWSAVGCAPPGCAIVRWRQPESAPPVPWTRDASHTSAPPV